MKRLGKILLLGLFIVFETSAQTLMTNSNQVVSLESGAVMTIQGNTSNSGTILNEGALRLHGDWSNSGEYRSVSGTFFLFNVVNFLPGTSSYNHLSIDGSGQIIFSSDLNISGELSLDNGILTFTDNYSLFLGKQSFISGASDASYVDGSIYSNQQGNTFFPVGTSTEYLPVELNGVFGNEPVGVRATSTAFNGVISDEVTEFSTDRFWQIIGSDFTASGITLPLENESILSSSDNPTIVFSEALNDPLGIFGPSQDETGFISATSNVLAGYYLIGIPGVTSPPIKVFNVLTVLQDGKHDFLRIENIEFYEDNLVEIFDRQGTKLFSMEGYNNADRVFRGLPNLGGRSELETGSYYFTVKFGGERMAGFFYLKNK